jgi:hypothetical protein
LNFKHRDEIERIKHQNSLQLEELKSTYEKTISEMKMEIINLKQTIEELKSNHQSNLNNREASSKKVHLHKIRI